MPQRKCEIFAPFRFNYASGGWQKNIYNIKRENATAAFNNNLALKNYKSPGSADCSRKLNLNYEKIQLKPTHPHRGSM